MGDLYRHYKGGLYRFIGDATLEWCADDDSCSMVVVYRSVETNHLWVRPRAEFRGVVSVNGKLVQRFHKVED